MNGKTLKDIAQDTGINYSTLRGYADRFSEYIPAYYVEGVRWKLYKETTISIVQLIAKHYAEGKHLHEIRTALEGEGYYPIVEAETDEIDPERGSDAPGVSRSMTPLSQDNDPLIALRDALHLSMETLRNYRDLAQYNAELVEALKSEVTLLRTKLAAYESAKED